VSKSLKKLRQGPVNTPSTNGRLASLDTGPTSSRPMTARATYHSNNDKATSSNFYYQLPGGTKGPLPPQLITKRPSTSRVSNQPSNGVSQSRVSSETNPINVQQNHTTSTNNVARSIDTANTPVPSSLRTPAKSLDIDFHHLDGFNLNSATIDEHPDKSRVNKEF
jgi:hypothetical protein